MTLFLLLLAIALIGVVAAVAAGRVRGGLDEPTSNVPYRPLPDGRIRSTDVDGVRFSLALRGYRMDEVDTVLRRLGTALAERDEEIAALRVAARSQGPDAGTGADPQADRSDQDAEPATRHAHQKDHGEPADQDVDPATDGPGARTR